MIPGEGWLATPTATHYVVFTLFMILVFWLAAYLSSKLIPQVDKFSKSILSFIKKYNNVLDLTRLYPGYVVDKRIFRVAFALIVLAGAAIAYSQDFDFSYHFYFMCPADGAACSNPWYDSYDVYRTLRTDDSVCNDNPGFCSVETFQPGQSYGRVPPPGLLRGMSIYRWSSVLLIVAALGLNHAIYNRKYGLLKKIKRQLDDAQDSNNGPE